LQIINEILYVCREPQVKTEVLNEVDISLRLLQWCLKQLMKQNFVRLHHRKQTYVTTDKGLRYLQLCTAIQKD
jgi:predicted transcriptional regulator